MKNKRMLLVLLALMPVIRIWAQLPAAILFVNSIPIGAEVRLDGRLLEESTPLLMRDLAPGEHRFEVKKKGYLAQELRIELAAGEMRTLIFDLVEQGISAMFPAEDRIVVLEEEKQAGERIFHFDRGSFTIAREQGEVYVDPLFPQQRLIDGLHIAIPILLVFSSLLTVDAVFSPSDSDWPLPPAVLAAHGITASMIGVDITLNLKKRKQLQSYSYFTPRQEQSEPRARRVYTEAERLLESGALSEAALRYSQIVSSFPDSPLLPQALYRLAGIHYLQGEHDAAILLYRRIVREYPVAELYDRCRKTLADLLLQAGSYEQSLQQLDGLVYYDPLYEPEQIHAYRCSILEQWVQSDPSAAVELDNCYREFLDRYPGSEMAENYRNKIEQNSPSR